MAVGHVFLRYLLMALSVLILPLRNIRLSAGKGRTYAYDTVCGLVLTQE